MTKFGRGLDFSPYIGSNVFVFVCIVVVCQDRCIAKPESYEERTKRRAAEIEGLKSALTTLENETAFVQRKSHGHLRRAIQ